MSGQFDLLFFTGREAGTSIQVDSIGDLQAGGANEGPHPGILQISGTNGTKARLEGQFIDGGGARFLTSLDLSGSGHFSQVSDTSDFEFYAEFQQ
jgi:hypothetical protein